MRISLKWGHTGVWKFDVRRTDQIGRSILVKVSRPMEFHLEPLAEPYVTLLRHTAPVIQPFLL